jgi:hypothetical protein
MLDSTLDSGMPSHKQRLAVRLRQMAIQQGDRLPVWLQRRMLGQDWVSEANRLDRARTRIYLRAMRKYQVKPYPGPAVLVKPTASAEVRLDQPDAAWGWGAHIDDLQVCEVPGTHKTHLQRGNAHVVARVLRPHLDRAAEAGQRPRQHQD